MNSLEFIKRHVTEWPIDNAIQVNLYNDGFAVFSNPATPPPYHAIDLSEHFAPDYHDGKVWTREEFESVSATVDATVEERGSRYGAFKDGADIMQSLKTVMRDTPNWSSLTPSQREALEMIQHKIGRILNGDPNYTDSWHDIQGYARLVEEELNGNVK